MRFVLAALAALLAGAVPALAANGNRAAEIHRRIADPDGGVIVVAHRGCHAAAPAHGLAEAPENSLAALDNCVAMGVDVMETDVRRSLDGELVMIHDATLDRSTGGKGPVSALTLRQLKQLQLRSGFGGPGAALTDQHVVTLAEMLARADRRIVLNLDIKEAIYPEVIEAVIRAGARDRVIVKTTASIATPPLLAVPPYDRVPFMPVLRFPEDERQLLDVMRTQLSFRRRPDGFELPHISEAILPDLARLARQHRTRLWINSLGDGYVAGIGGDAQAPQDPRAVWGRLRDAGVSMFQTDYPEALLAFLGR